MISALSSWRLSGQIASGWLTSSVLLVGLLTALPGAHADTIPDWNLITAKALQTAKAGTGLAHSRVYAMVHGAMFDAANAIDRRYQSYAADLEAPPGAAQDAAAAVAAHMVLRTLTSTTNSTFDAALAASLGKVQDGQAKADGVALGKAAAEEYARAAQQRQDEARRPPSHQKAAPAYFSCPLTLTRLARIGHRLRRSCSRALRTSACRARHRWRARATLRSSTKSRLWARRTARCARRSRPPSPCCGSPRARSPITPCCA